MSRERILGANLAAARVDRLPSVSSPAPDAAFVSRRTGRSIWSRELRASASRSSAGRTASGFPVLAACGRDQTEPGHWVQRPSRRRADRRSGEMEARSLGRRDRRPAFWPRRLRCQRRGGRHDRRAATAPAAGIEPATDLLLHIVTDEEVAGDCTDECLERGWPDAVIVGEPSELDVWIAEPGLEQVRIEVDGIATHALNRWRALPDTPGSEVGA